MNIGTLGTATPHTHVPPDVSLFTRTAPLRVGPGTQPFSIGLGIQVILRGTSLKDSPWRLASDLVVEVKMTGSAIVAIHHGVDEYGIGDTVDAAIEDLLTSLADYRLSLEKREDRLADKPRRDLDTLRKLLESNE